MAGYITQHSLESLGIEPYPLKKGEEYMNPAQIAHFRKLLLALKKRLVDQADKTVHSLQDEAAVPADPLDRASHDEEVNIAIRTRERELILLRKIDEALELLSSGEYGYCVDCGADIGVRRLEARPTAVQCIDCKSFNESRENAG